MELLQAYADTSGQERETDKILTVNGCLSTPVMWAAFENEWQSYLKSKGFKPDAVTGQYVFHASPFWANECPLMPDNLTNSRKRDIYNHLVSLICKYTVYRFGYGVLLDECRDFEKDFPYVRGLWLKKPGTRMSLLCIKWNSVWAQNHGYNPAIAYMFDRGDKHYSELNSIYNEATNKGLGAELVTSMGVGNKAHHSHLQAADIVAWECRRYFLSMCVNGKSVPFAHLIQPDNALKRLSDPKASDLRLYGYNDLKDDFLEVVSEDMGEDEAAIIGEGMPFKDIEDYARGLCRLDKQQQVEDTKARQAMAKAKKENKK